MVFPMPFDPKAIVGFIRSRADYPMKMKELAKALAIPNPSYSHFRNVVKALIARGELVKLKRGRIGLASELNMVVGILQVTRAGVGFVPREGNDDVMIAAPGLLTAFDGDKVMVRLTGEGGGRQMGAVVNIVERAERRIVGTFREGKHFFFVEPDNPRIHRDIYIGKEDSLKAKDGEKVVVQLEPWTDPKLNPDGIVAERLGFPGDPGVDMLTVMRGFNLPDTFPAEVMRDAEIAAGQSIDDEIARRENLTKECIYTIDPEDAKDHDDAINVERLPHGYRLGVHIADVSYYVREGTVLDKEALNRGNSVYLPGTVVPMLPEVLSNDVCSLRPNRVRLAQSCIMDFDQKGKLLKWRVADTVIKSHAKLSYEQAQEFFNIGKADTSVAHVADNLTVARELAQVLTKRRFAEGSLDFDLPESKIILGKDGEVVELGNRVRLESHRLVEECMLAANVAVALEVFRAAQPFIYRVHDKPDMKKLEAFSDTMKRIGRSFPVSATMQPVQFSRFLESVKDTPESEFINELMLRSMKKAVYQRANIGHFGLAFSHYTHFTSPIRRYPDLLVHRLLRSRVNGVYPAPLAKRIIPFIDSVASHCSTTERDAEAAERQAIKVKQVAYMARHLGAEFPGIISGIIAHGFFVRLDNLGVDGMVRVSSIDDDFYQFDEQHFRLVGRRTGTAYRLGDKVKVKVIKVDTVRHEIDLGIAGLESKPKVEGRPLKKPGNVPHHLRNKRGRR
jgi:ribonuclease R